MKIIRTLKAVTLVSLAVFMVSSCGGFEGKPMPADYPLPVYPGAQAPNDGYREVMGARSQILNSTDDPAKVAEFYKAELEKGGWKDVKVVESGGNYVVSGQKVNGKQVEAANVQASGKAIVLTYMKQ
jgi:hypothetical protein